MTATIPHALEHAARGWRVHPIDGKRPVLTDWPNQATTDESQITEWWSNGYAKCNVGIATGRTSGIVVIDIDPRNGGDEGFAELVGRCGPLPETVTVQTPSGGRHYYFRYPQGNLYVGNGSGLGGVKGVDWKGDGGQVAAPPSIGANGKTYHWISEVSHLADLPPAWVDLLRPVARKPLVSPFTRPAEPIACDVERAKACLPKLSQARCDDYEQWVRVGMALHSVDCSDDMLAAWDLWSQRSNKYHSFECAAKWATFDPEGSGAPIGLGSLIAWAREDSGDPGFGRIDPNDVELVQRDGSTGNGSASIASTSPATANDPALDDVMRQKAARTLTDTGNGERFAKQWRGRVLWCPRRGWLVWDGRRFADNDGQAVEALAVKTARRIYLESAACKDGDIAKKIADWAHKSEAKARVDAMLGMAKHLLAVKADELDADQWKLNVENGILDLKTGELRAHDPQARMTRLASVTFNPAAEAPRFMAFLKTTFQGDDALIKAVQRQAGMFLTGDVSEQFLFIYHGVGANGKSTLCDLLLHILGDYAGPAAPDLLTASKQRQHPTELADLQGRRLIVASETESGQTLKIQLVKMLTGDRAIKARMMHQDFYTFQRTHKLVLMTNNRPRIRENTEATWRRIQLVPFSNVVPKGQRDPNLLDALKGEASGVLNWLIAGCLAWQRDGLGETAAITKATKEYQGNEDVIAEFVDSRCKTDDPNAWVSRSDIYKAYLKWCEDESETKPLSRNALYDHLRSIEGVIDDQRRPKQPQNAPPVKGFSGIKLAE